MTPTVESEARRHTNSMPVEGMKQGEEVYLSRS